MNFWLFLLMLVWNGEKSSKTDAEWKKTMEEDQFYVMRRKGTERAYSGKYLFTATEGIYHCAACDTPLWSSEDKFPTYSGWASFKKPVASKNVYYLKDSTPYVCRYEVLCSCCNSHLGHVFHDGPPPKYLRYCINSISLQFKPSPI